MVDFSFSTFFEKYEREYSVKLSKPLEFAPKLAFLRISHARRFMTILKTHVRTHSGAKKLIALSKASWFSNVKKAVTTFVATKVLISP